MTHHRPSRGVMMLAAALTLSLMIGGCTLTTVRPTATPRPLPTLPPAVGVSPDGCPIPAGWLRYEVQSGDALSRVAQRVNVPTELLVRANCLRDANSIRAGQVLYLPSLPGG